MTTKSMQKHGCPTCGLTKYLEMNSGIGGKIGGGVAGAALAAGLKTKHPLLAGLIVLGGVALGHKLIDQELIPNCPSCGVALQALEPVIEMALA